MQGQFSQQSLITINSLLSEDFTRCERPNGTFYGTGGTCRKGVETGPSDIFTKSGSPRGRVPRDDPKEPLASGFTPLEKAENKLSLFENKLNDPDYSPSDKEMTQYGLLNLAIERFKNSRDGRTIKGLFGDKTDNSDIDDSAARKGGSTLRKQAPLRETLTKSNRSLIQGINAHKKWKGKELSKEGLAELEQIKRDLSSYRKKLLATPKNNPAYELVFRKHESLAVVEKLISGRINREKVKLLRKQENLQNAYDAYLIQRRLIDAREFGYKG
jgi:hypothetical protein